MGADISPLQRHVPFVECGGDRSSNDQRPRIDVLHHQPPLEKARAVQRLVLIAADTAIMRTVQLALRSAGGFSVVGCLDGRGAVGATLAEHRPDVILVDDMCQRANAITRLREATRLKPDALVVLLTSSLEDCWLDDVFCAGADAVVGRGLAPAVLGSLLREIVSGTVVHSPRRRRSAIGVAPPASLGLSAQTARTSA
jgi:DNA-binding NarL/FixJ family response regulator